MSHSSSDEEPGFQSSLSFPKMSRPKPSKSPTPKVAVGKIKGAKKFLAGRPKERFPDSFDGQHQKITSTISSNNNSSDSDEFTVPEAGQVGFGGASLPQFDWNRQHVASAGAGSSSEESDDGAEMRGLHFAKPAEIAFDDDSSDEEPNVSPFVPPQATNVPETIPEGSGSPSKASAVGSKGSGGGYPLTSDPIEPPRRGSEHTTRSFDSKRSSKSQKSRTSRTRSVRSRPSLSLRKDSVRSGESNKSEGTGVNLKGLLKKLALVNEDYAPGFAPDSDHEPPRRGSITSGAGSVAASNSNGEGFMGKIFSMGPGGLSGGGLAPGATYRSDEKPGLDEEGAIENEGHEMTRLDAADLDDHAKNLILQHVPDAAVHFDESRSSMDSGVGPHEGSSEDRPRVGPGSMQNGFVTDNRPANLLDERDAPDNEMLLDAGEDYVPPPKQLQAGVLSSLLKLYHNPEASKSEMTMVSGDESWSDEEPTPGMSRATTSQTLSPSNAKNSAKKFAKNFMRKKNRGESFSGDDSETMGEKTVENLYLPSFANAKPRAPKKKKHPNFNKLNQKVRHNKRNQRLRITVHITDILNRQRFIMRMCRALMMFGAPTHRLEEYMSMTSRVLEIDGQFVYFPGTMIISFGDAATRTSEVNLVRCVQGVNLSKLADTHKLYKLVIHDLISVDEASQKLDELLKSKNKFPAWVCVLLYGIGSLAVSTFAFGGGWIDLPICFALGLCVGYMQFFISSMSNLYSSVFEVTASIVVSFIARAIGSVRGGDLFCFSAIAQGSLALILPGYIILCGSLELQSRNIVAGSVRMFYAIIYSLFLGFGITLGAALYGWIDKKSTSANSCTPDHNMDDKFRILFVPMFTICLGLINQARWRQLPAMLVISCTGYVGTYFAGKHFNNVTEFTACIGAFFIGILGNMYSRLGKGMAVSAMLPAIFVQVPGGIAAQSNLISGVQTADQINRKNDTSTAVNHTSSLAFGATMVEVSIGISVGLFAAALVVYPFGKKRTGLFSL
ncbi:hypothetical protein DICA2_D16050 [Diutina catenulata]